MGLAGAKNRRKLAKDPNNTRWSRNTDSFGQKILRSQGWQPGDYLGARDAAHAEFHTAANATHVRAVLKDDNLGLGARRNNGDECTGLDAFQDLLGRLNGKSEQALETERTRRTDVKLSHYIERKFGTMRFVRGGLLVGDKHDDEEKAESREKEAAVKQGDSSKSVVTPPESSEEREEKKSKKDKKSKKRKAESDDDVEVESDARAKKEKSERKEEKRRRKEEKAMAREEKPEDAKAASDALGDIDIREAEEATSKDKTKRKSKDKKSKGRDSDEELKEKPGPSRKEKKEKREKKKKRQNDGDGEPSSAEGSSGEPSSVQTSTETGLSTPVESGTSTPVSTNNRYLARKRFIAQKRAAVMDPQALNQIFMVKS